MSRIYLISEAAYRGEVEHLLGSQNYIVSEGLLTLIVLFLVCVALLGVAFCSLYSKRKR